MQNIDFKWVLATPFFFLPLFGHVFMFVVVLVGMYGLLRHRNPWWVGFWIFVFLGSIGQILAPSSVIPALPWVNSSTSQTNLLSFASLITLQGWNTGGVVGATGQYVGAGFWRSSRYNPNTMQEYAEIATYEVVKVEPNTQYTLSFYFRSDGTQTGFLINFITPNQYNFVQPTVVHLGGNWYRAYASYTTKPSETELRGLNLAGFSGDWQNIEVGYPQLELGGQPTQYNVATTNTQLTSRLIWWVGTAVLGLLVFMGSYVLLWETGGARAGLMIFLGLTVHLAYAVISIAAHDSFGGRAVGLLGHPNILGHAAVVCASLVWILLGNRWGLGAVAVSSGLVVLSASRAAFLGIILLAFTSWLNFWPRVREMTFIAVGGLGLLGIFVLSQNLDRLMTLGSGQDLGSQSRLAIWQSAIRAFSEHPITGIGINQFSIYHYTHFPSSAVEPLVGHAHNLFLFLLAETGTLGLAGFLALWLGIMWMFLKQRMWEGVLMIIAILLLNLSDLTFFTSSIYASVWVAAAWGWCIATKSRLPAKLVEGPSGKFQAKL